ncbi:MAG: hypothetical protein E6Q66_09890 [Pedobacter sp.]|jgi:hypothetical protein|nr:MAG: hypothetical protein E6Q66_09890 [Pedobacter sp.]
MISLAYQAIKKRLNDSIPEVSGRIHWYSSLLTDDHAEPVFQTPTLFIEFGETQMYELKGHQNRQLQGGHLFFSIHCIEQFNYDDDAVLNALSIADKVSKALHKRDFKLSELPEFESFKGTHKDWVLLSTIVRTAISADHRHVNLADSVVRFGCEVVDVGVLS